MLKLPRWLGILLVLGLILVIALVYLDFHLFLRPLPEDFDQAMAQEMKAAKIPGATFLVIQDGQIHFAKGYGLADPETGRPVTPDTLFTLASVSKTVTATALMTLYDQGDFQLDDDINQYLPFAVRNPNFPDTPITFRMLLAHTSSLRDSDVYNSFYTLTRAPELEDSPLPLGEYLADYLSPAGAYYNAKANFTSNAPGTAYVYSNTGFGLVGYLVERLSGQTFETYCREAVFEPLGMTQSAWMFRDVDHEQMAVPYSYNSLLRRPVRIGFYGYPTFPDGSLKTSANEFARFLTVFLNEGRTPEGLPFLRPETVQEMLRTQYPDAGTPVGLAWHVSSTSFVHTGGDPGMNTLTVIKPQEKIGFLFFTNSDGGDKMILGTVRLQFFYQRMSPLMKAWYEK